MKKFNWFLVQERGDNIPLNPGVQPLFEKYTTLSERFLGQAPHHALVVFHHGGGRYYPDLDEWKKAEQAVLDKVQNDPSYMQNLLDEYKDSLPKLSTIDNEITSTDLSTLSDLQLWSLFDRYFQTYKEIYPCCEAIQFWLSQPLTDYLDEYLRNVLREHHQEKSFGESFEILITPPEIPFTTKEERALLEIALEISKDQQLKGSFVAKESGDLHSELRNHPAIDRLLDEHERKFEWVPFDYGNPKWDKAHFVNALSEMFKNKFDFEKRTRTIDNYFTDIEKRQRDLSQKLGIDAHHQQLFNALRVDAHTIDYKKETLTQSNFIAARINDEICQRFDITKELSMRLSYDDIEKILKEGHLVNFEQLKERWEQTVWFIDNEKSLILEGEEAKKFLEDQGLTKQELEESMEVKGITASGGRAVGTAKVITSPKEFDKMNQGDILITFMTTPEYVPILRKAAAVVTNEGGITCHAAIIARELSIPCVVGTKNASDVFKDGDKIEVRANHGVARKI